MTKRLTSLRISDYTTAEIRWLQDRIGANQSEIIMLAVARMYRQENGPKNPMAQEEQMYYVDTDMLGGDATPADVARMVELLTERGVDAQAGSPLRSDHDTDACPDHIWEECLNILSREKYS